MRVRGLKQSGPARSARGVGSHPVRVRGLKHGQAIPERSVCRSHPVRVRGLKHPDYITIDQAVKGRTPCGCVG